MTTKNLLFSSMDSTDKWLFVGHLCAAVGILCVSIGTALKLAREGALPMNTTINVKANSSTTSVDSYFN